MKEELSSRSYEGTHSFGDQLYVDQQTSSKEGPLENEGQQLRKRRPDVGCPTSGDKLIKNWYKGLCSTIPLWVCAQQQHTPC